MSVPIVKTTFMMTNNFDLNLFNVNLIKVGIKS